MVLWARSNSGMARCMDRRNRGPYKRHCGEPFLQFVQLRLACGAFLNMSMDHYRRWIEIHMCWLTEQYLQVDMIVVQVKVPGRPTNMLIEGVENAGDVNATLKDSGCIGTLHRQSDDELAHPLGPKADIGSQELLVFRPMCAGKALLCTICMLRFFSDDIVQPDWHMYPGIYSGMFEVPFTKSLGK